MKIRWLLVLILLVALGLVGCGQPEGSHLTTAPGTVSSAAGSTSSANTAAVSGTAAATSETTEERSMGIRDIISDDEIGAVLGSKPVDYRENVKPRTLIKTGSYVFAGEMYFDLGVVIGMDTIKNYNYRDPATPRLDSEITAYTVLETPAYLDTQYMDTLVDNKVVTILNNCQLICIKDDVYYYISAGYFPKGSEQTYIALMPKLLEKLIHNTQVKLAKP